MSSGNLAQLLWLIPITMVIGLQLSFWLVNRDIEIIIRRAIKNAIKDIRREYE